jgi:hypothetical protein
MIDFRYVRAFLYSICLISISLQANAFVSDTLTVKGFVKSKETSKPLASVNVTLKNSATKTKSDSKGSFSLKPQRNILVSNPVLHFSAPGFESAEGEIDSKYLKDLKLKELNIGVVLMEKEEEKDYNSLSQWLFAKAKNAVKAIVK